MTKKIKKLRIFLVEDERFDSAKRVLDDVLGKDNYDLSFACCMKTALYYLNMSKSGQIKFDLLLFDVRLIDTAYDHCSYIGDFYKYLAMDIPEGECNGRFKDDMRSVNLDELSPAATKLKNGNREYWTNGGLLLWAEFLNLYNRKGWRFRSIFFTAFNMAFEQYKFLERAGIVRATDKIFGPADARILASGSDTGAHAIIANYDYYLRTGYFTYLFDQMRDGREFDELKEDAKIIFHPPDGEAVSFSFQTLPNDESDFKRILNTSSLETVRKIDHYHDPKDNTFHFTFELHENPLPTQEVAVAEVQTIITEYVKNIQEEKHTDELIFVNAETLDSIITGPLDLGRKLDLQPTDSEEAWTFRSFFAIQQREIEKISKSFMPDSEKKERINTILYQIKKEFSRQDLAKLFGRLFKTGGVERITHTSWFAKGKWGGYHSYDNKVFRPHDEGQREVYLDSIKELIRILKGISDLDMALIWGEEWKQKLSEISMHLNHNGGFSWGEQLTDWLLELGDGGSSKQPENSLLRLDGGKRDFFKKCIPVRDSIKVSFDDSSPDDDSILFLPKLRLQDALKSIFEETLTQAQRCGSTSLNFSIFFADPSDSGRLVTVIGHDGTKGFFQSDKLVNKNPAEIDDQDIEKLINLKCFSGTHGILSFKNWLDFHLVSKCKDNEFVIIDMFQRKKLLIDEAPVRLDNRFSIYYLLFVSKAEKTPAPVETP